jgi:hypothetical protein
MIETKTKNKDKQMRNFICENCFIKVDGQFYDDTHIIGYSFYCDDCYSEIKSKGVKK